MSSAAMNLLLLLSALLSALTGVGASVRAPERSPVVAAASVGSAQAVLAPAHVAHRPASASLALVAVATMDTATIPAFRAIPAWIDRRRE